MIHPHENDLRLHRRTARLPKNICGVLQNPLGYHGYRLSWCIVTFPPDPNILEIQFVWYPPGLVDAMISNHPIASVKGAELGRWKQQDAGIPPSKSGRQAKIMVSGYCMQYGHGKKQFSPKKQAHTEGVKAGVRPGYTLWAPALNSRIKVSLWDVHVHFDCAGSRTVCVARSSRFWGASFFPFFFA